MNKQNESKLIDTVGKLKLAGWGRGEGDWEVQMSGRKSSRRDVRHSTGNAAGNTVVPVSGAGGGRRRSRAVSPEGV